MVEFTWRGYIIGKGKLTFRNTGIISVSSFHVFLSLHCSLFIPSVTVFFLDISVGVSHTFLRQIPLYERKRNTLPPKFFKPLTSYEAILLYFCFSLLKSSLPSLSLWKQWRIIVGATKCIPKSELPEEPEENSVTSNRLWTHPSDLTIALSASTPLYPPGRIIHVVHNHPAEQCW